MEKRSVLTRYTSPDLHWVGDGFLTQNMLPVADHAADTSPFLIAGYNAPKHFEATSRPRGVGMHPHRGFETVTIVYQGGLRHGDTMGNGGTLGPGDVQWMTAARGVQHEEFHSEVINAQGGTLEMVQLWVNLPAAEKMSEPEYQTIEARQIPQVQLDGGQLRVIAGSYGEGKGPARTRTDLHVWDVTLHKGAEFAFTLPASMTVSVLLLSGEVMQDGHLMSGPETAVFRREAGEVRLKAVGEAHFLVLAGEPINEPIAMAGPFVMNSQAELRQAWSDFRMGRF